MKVGGYRVDPQEIEDVIMDSGLVVEAAVVGMPDDLQSTVIEALIVPVIVTDGQEELFVHCARCLPRYKVPQHFFVIAELPKNGNGKIDRRQCAEMISHLQARQRTAVESRSIHA
jgi:acyl-coenzyme A synthetase/AMP-(fatty) acid ligase